MSDIPAELEAQFQQPAPTAPEPQGEQPPPASEAGPAGGAPPAEPAEAEYVQLYDGYKVSTAEARQLGEFYDWVKANPTKAQEFVGYLEGRYELHPQGQARSDQSASPPPPAGEEVDPAVAQLRQELAQVRGEVESQRALTARSAVAEASRAFKDQMQLSDQEVERLLAEAYSLNIVPAISARMASLGRVDAVGAVKEALERTYWQLPEMREREIARQSEEWKRANQRQRKQAGLGGNSGSVPRGTAEPRTPEERREAMINEIAAAMRQGSEE